MKSLSPDDKQLLRETHREIKLMQQVPRDTITGYHNLSQIVFQILCSTACKAAQFVVQVVVRRGIVQNSVTE